MQSLTDPSPQPPCPAPFNMAAHVLRHAPRLGDKTALCIVGAAPEVWSYADLHAAVLGTGTGLLRAGVTPGDRVLMRLGNTVDFPLAYLAALAIGAVPVPTAAALTTREVAPMIAALDPRVILSDPDVPCPDDPRSISREDLRAMRALPAADVHMGDADRPGYIIYTSGTSGRPRAVEHAHRAIWARQMMFDGWYGLRADDRVMHAGAFNWTYTLGTGLMDPWTMGATALIPAPGTKATDLPTLMADSGATIFAAAPGVYRQLTRAPVPALPRLRHGLSAGEKLADVTRAAWQDATGTPIFEAYGMSECSTFISASPARPAAPGALGCAQPGRRLALIEGGTPVARGAEGTIAVHRTDPGLMRGYLDAPDETAAKFADDWFLTGDRAVMDAQGQITYLGRDDDMMNAGGFRVSPLEVEQCLTAHPDITGAAAVEVTVKAGASVIAAYYTAAAPLDEDALHRYAEANLARYKQPRLYIHTDALPTGANGKLLRRQLRQRFEENT
ncbi:acyl--CoA ligase [Sulfitobacter albidus]|uniref:Acyl--CoA ligase n=1 Tax=Sulfitobacter albidus TaxID=2829501 RepID=A0A975JG16_9RHOB|nr:class I adenylate-forming enzyme family protein [Sulfitobacter albidus]QUJ77637.1 acyl--CoA ligase [Sulfitobacter albidus]